MSVDSRGRECHLFTYINQTFPASRGDDINKLLVIKAICLLLEKLQPCISLSPLKSTLANYRLVLAFYFVSIEAG